MAKQKEIKLSISVDFFANRLLAVDIDGCCPYSVQHRVWIHLVICPKTQESLKLNNEPAAVAASDNIIIISLLFTRFFVHESI